MLLASSCSAASVAKKVFDDCGLLASSGCLRTHLLIHCLRGEVRGVAVGPPVEPIALPVGPTCGGGRVLWLRGRCREPRCTICWPLEDGTPSWQRHVEKGETQSSGRDAARERIDKEEAEGEEEADEDGEMAEEEDDDGEKAEEEEEDEDVPKGEAHSSGRDAACEAIVNDDSEGDEEADEDGEKAEEEDEDMEEGEAQNSGRDANDETVDWEEVGEEVVEDDGEGEEDTEEGGIAEYREGGCEERTMGIEEGARAGHRRLRRIGTKARVAPAQAPFPDLPPQSFGLAAPPLLPHQLLVAEVLHPLSVVQRLLVDHPTGAGKTRSMIAALDNFFADPRAKLPIFQCKQSAGTSMWNCSTGQTNIEIIFVVWTMLQAAAPATPWIGEQCVSQNGT